MTDLIVDGNSLFARSWFASQKMDEFEPGLAIGLAVKTLLTIMSTDSARLGLRFNRMLFAWDGENAHHKKREPKPPEYHETKDVLRDTLTSIFNAEHCDHPDHEGDDIVATAVFESDAADTLVVVSGDKDLQQLQGKNVHFYCLNAKSIISRAFICNKWHIKRPNQLAIALAIQGDQVDEIPGIHGWGAAKVKKLFGQVPKTAKFDEALHIIESQIPKDKLDEFYGSLDRTLLTANVSGVPKPAQIKMATPINVAGMHIPGIMSKYEPVYVAYARRL